MADGAVLGDLGGIRIPHAEILPGLHRIHESGVRHFGDALCLYAANRAQDAIPSFVLSVEEYLKGIYLAIAHREQRGISASEWELLHTHEFKLKKIKSGLDGTLDKTALEKIYGDYSHWDLDVARMTRSMFSREVDECDKEVTEITRLLQALKHACTYHNWNAKASQWEAFSSLSGYARRSLAFHAMHIAKCYHDLFVHSVGTELKLPCPRTCATLSPIPPNPFKFYASRRVLQVIQSNRSILTCPRNLTADIINMSTQIGLTNRDESNSHPLVRSISAFVSEQPTLRDGRHKYSSDDSGQTPDGKPTMSVSVSMQVEGNIGTLEQATINHDTCDVYDSRIAIILEAEKIIERKRGPALSRLALTTLFSRLGIQSYRFTYKNMSRSLKNAKELLEDGHLCHYPKRIVDHIRSATLADWFRMDPQARNVISALLLHNPTAISLDEYESLMQKHRARVMAWDVLCAQKAVYDNLLVLY